MKQSQPGQHQTNAPQEEPLVVTDTEAGFTTNVGFTNPGSPNDAAGIEPLPSVGGIGALDPGAGGDIMGDDETHDQGIVDDDAKHVMQRGERNSTTQGSSGGGSSSVVSVGYAW